MKYADSRLDPGFLWDISQLPSGLDDWGRDALNAGRLPEGYFAMAEQVVGQPEADVVALEVDSDDDLTPGGGGTPTAIRPQTAVVVPAEEERYAAKATRLVIHHGLGRVVAVVETVSPGSTISRHACGPFADKAVSLSGRACTCWWSTCFRPGPRPAGDPSADLGRDQRPALRAAIGQTANSSRLSMRPTKTAYVEPVVVGDRLPKCRFLTTSGTCRRHWKPRTRPPGALCRRRSGGCSTAQ